MIQENHESEENFDLPKVEEGQEDSTDWKAKATELQQKAREGAIRQRERTKALKAELEEARNLKPQDKKKVEKPDDMLLERLDKMALKVSGIKEADEVELFNKWKEATGREADDIVGNEIFTKELESLRTAKATLAATSNIKGDSGELSGAKSNADYWIAKATKGDDGKLRFPDETPKELYSKILDKMAAGEPSSSGGLKFYNE